MKSKAQRDKTAANLEREIRAFSTPTNPKAATAQWLLVVELSRVLGEPVGVTKRRLWPKAKAED
mgnify:CR=1 FL=1